ncbi:MAG: alpha/beta fold hydrolase [Pseudomonadota bacterium]
MTSLVIHGRNGAVDSDHMRPIIEALRAHGAVCAPDLRFSDANGSEGTGRGFTLSQHLDDARRVLDSLRSSEHDEPIMMAGHSVGAFAALSLAAEYGAAVVCGVLAVSPAISGQALLAARAAMGPGALAALNDEAPQAAADYRRHDLLPKASSIGQPVALLVGEDDGLTPPSDVSRLADALPRVVGHEVIPGVHHCPVGAAVEAAYQQLASALVQASQ